MSDHDINDDIRSRRVTYERGELDTVTVAPDPFEQFRVWLEQALHAPRESSSPTR